VKRSFKVELRKYLRRRSRSELRKGSAVEVTGWPKLRGTCTEIRKKHARVLFPIRSWAWFPIAGSASSDSMAMAVQSDGGEA
jgi:hypothetical protein